MKTLFLALVLLLPPVSYAVSTPTDFADIVVIILDVINTLIAIVFTMSLLVFMWGIMKGWVLNAGDEAAVQKGKSVAVVGIVVLFVTASIYGILAILRYSLFGIS